MRIALLADLHGNREATEACLAALSRAGCNHHVFLGDLVGYGADPDWVVDTVRAHVDAGAVSGGGLTVIANAPNPAGMSIVRRHFKDQTVHPLGLLLAALPPTLVAMAAFRLL